MPDESGPKNAVFNTELLEDREHTRVQSFAGYAARYRALIKQYDPQTCTCAANRCGSTGGPCAKNDDICVLKMLGRIPSRIHK
jgi:hypothetical protein